MISLILACLLALSACGGGDQALPPLRGANGEVKSANPVRPGGDGVRPGGDREDDGVDDDPAPGGAEGEPGESEAGDDNPLCPVFDRIIELDLEMDYEMTEAMRPFEAAVDRGDRAGAEREAAAMVALVSGALDRTMTPLIEAYDQVIALAPELESDVVFIRDFTVRFTDQFVARAGTVDGYIALFSDDDLMEEANEAGMASLRLNDVSLDECGVTIAN